MHIVGQVNIEGVRLNFWDLGGQEELQSLWDKVNRFLIIISFLIIFIHYYIFIGVCMRREI